MQNLAQDNFSAIDAWLVTLHFTWPEFSQLPPLPIFARGYIESELPGDLESRTFVDHLAEAFVSNSCRVERNPFIGRVRVDIYTRKEGKSFGLIPYVDHFFAFILESEPEKSLETLLSVNRNALSFVDSIHRTPRLWRWTVPTTTTIAISSGRIPSATTEYVRAQNLSAVGVPNSLILVDLRQRSVISVEHQLGDMGTLPIGRASTTIRNMCDSVFRKLNGS